MDSNKVICVYANDQELSCQVAACLRRKLRAAGFTVPETYEEGVEIMVCVGGDGTLLRAAHAYDFPNISFVGVNTGHLGFFQELQYDEPDRLVDILKNGNYSVQRHRLVQVAVHTDSPTPQVYKGLNDIVIRGSISRVTHLNLSIGSSFIEKFSGDGILIASAAGSTAYNYSLGGSILDPRLNLLQITPIAPMNTTAYRCFTSSVLVPADMEIHIYTEDDFKQSAIVVVDGYEHPFEDVERVTVTLSPDELKLIRLEDYDFWTKVKTKFL